MKRVLSFAAMAIVGSTLLVGLATARPTGESPSAWLGVYTQSINDDIAEGFKLPVKSGAIISEVIEDSPADQAGLMDRDIVVAIDGDPVETAEDLTSTIGKHSAGDIVTVKVLRDGKDREFRVTLAERQESPKRIVKKFAFGDSDDEPEDMDAPSARAFKFYSQALSDSYIGVELTSLSDQLRTYFGVTGDRGVLVASVQKDTPADKAGLKAGDVIVGADGKEISEVADLQDVIGDQKKGDKVSLSLIRDRKELTVPVEVAEHEGGSGHARAFRTITLPDMGSMSNPNMPRMKGLWFGTRDGKQDLDDLREELSTLREQMADLKKQLEELHKHRK
ncbi:MAG: PDZ domain-containing protein [candidate division Zixibacteria bacterium]|nr:PDZ domain-containing protein [candidate division Zixibacteria bacterium]